MQHHHCRGCSLYAGHTQKRKPKAPSRILSTSRRAYFSSSRSVTVPDSRGEMQTDSTNRLFIQRLTHPPMSTRKLIIALIASTSARNSSRLAEATAHALLRHLPAEFRQTGGGSDQLGLEKHFTRYDELHKDPNIKTVRANSAIATTPDNSLLPSRREGMWPARCLCLQQLQDRLEIIRFTEQTRLTYMMM